MSSRPAHRTSSAVLTLVVALAGCGSAPRPSAPAAPAARPSVLAAVGAHPRGYARLDLQQPRWQSEMAGALDAIRRATGHTPAACGFDPTRMRELRAAVGEPLRVAAEVDGAISLHVLTCLIGAEEIAALTRAGIELADRPGGLAIAYRPDRGHAAAATVQRELTERCAGPSCAALVLGPPDDRLWLTGTTTATRLEVRIAGARVPRDAAATFARAVAQSAITHPALHDLAISDDHGALVIELPQQAPALAAALKSELLEAFHIPSSSMFPTLRQGDSVFAIKGPLFAPPQPGDVLVFRHGPEEYIKRYLAGPGHTVSESGGAIAIDGHTLATEVEREVSEDEVDDGTTVTLSGMLVREHLGARSYPTFRSTGSPPDGSWVVPEGSVFLVGDARENSNDSRYFGPVSQTDLVGRVAFIWYASENGAPDWTRIGMLVR